MNLIKIVWHDNFGVFTSTSTVGEKTLTAVRELPLFESYCQSSSIWKRRLSGATGPFRIENVPSISYKKRRHCIYRISPKLNIRMKVNAKHESKCEWWLPSKLCLLKTSRHLNTFRWSHIKSLSRQIDTMLGLKSFSNLLLLQLRTSTSILGFAIIITRTVDSNFQLFEYFCLCTGCTELCTSLECLLTLPMMCVGLFALPYCID